MAGPGAVGTAADAISERLTRGRDGTAKAARGWLERADMPAAHAASGTSSAASPCWWASWAAGSSLRGAGALVLRRPAARRSVGPGPAARRAEGARRAPGQEVRAQLPDVLTLLASSLAPGFSLPQALDAVVRDAAEPSAKEFSRALAETRIGADSRTRSSGWPTAWSSATCAGPSWRSGSSARSAATSPRRCGRRRATLRERSRSPAGARAVGRGPALGVHPHRAARRHLPVHAEVNRDYSRCCGPPRSGIVMIVGGVVVLASASSGCASVVKVEV